MTDVALHVTDDRTSIERLSDLFDRQHGDSGLPSSFFELDPQPHDEPNVAGSWRFTMYCEAHDLARWENTLEQLVVQCGLTASVDVEDLGERDWISETLRDLAPVRAGRFIVHGSHDRGRANGSIRIEIDAGLAFGTGHHGTTMGCLELLEDVARRRKPRNAFDVGTGSGVLAIAAARCLKVPALASDVDPTATRVAHANAVLNGCGPLVSTFAATGLSHPAYEAAGNAELVFANILAGPLRKLARPIAERTAPGGEVILSGLLPRQGAHIVSTYRAHGLVLRRRLVRDGWLSLLLRKP